MPHPDSDTRTYRNDIGRDTRPYQKELDAHTRLHWKGTGPLPRLEEGGFGVDSRPFRTSLSPAARAVQAGAVRSPSAGGRPLARHRKPPSRRMRKAASATAVVLAGGGAAVGLLYATGGQPVLTGAADANLHTVTSAGTGKATTLATPAVAGAPTQAYAPRHAAGPARRAAATTAGTAAMTGGGAATGASSLSPNTRAGAGAGVTGSPSDPAPSTSPSSSSSSSSSSTPSSPTSASPAPSSATATTSAPPSGTATPPLSTAGGACADPTFTTSSAFGSETVGAYTISNDMWNAGGGGISQTLSACSAGDWSVDANIALDGGGVKTYPNSAYVFATPPEISSLGSVTSTFGSTLPASGEFADAYDIWLNGTAGGGDEVQIWTDNQGRTPAGAAVGTAYVDGQTYTVWQEAGGPITFVAATNVTAGDLNLLPFFQWLTSNGYEPSSSTLDQVAFGTQITSTNATAETFGVNNFSVIAS